MELKDIIIFNSNWKDYKINISEDLKSFLKGYAIECFINDNLFSSVYNSGYSGYHQFSDPAKNIPQLTNLLLKANINIFPGLTRLHPYLFYRMQGIDHIDLRDFQYQNIDEFAFAETSIQSISLPGTIKTIGKGAFADIKNLKIFFDGDADMWIAINKASSWGIHTPIKVICSSGQTIDYT